MDLSNNNIIKDSNVHQKPTSTMKQAYNKL